MARRDGTVGFGVEPEIGRWRPFPSNGALPYDRPDSVSWNLFPPAAMGVFRAELTGRCRPPSLNSRVSPTRPVTLVGAAPGDDADAARREVRPTRWRPAATLGMACHRGRRLRDHAHRDADHRPGRDHRGPDRQVQGDECVRAPARTRRTRVRRAALARSIAIPRLATLARNDGRLVALIASSPQLGAAACSRALSVSELLCRCRQPLR